MTLRNLCSRSSRPPGSWQRAGQRLAGAAILLLMVLIVSEKNAYAYTDPGSGALMWQLLLAAMLGISFYFRKLLGWIREWKKKPQDEDPGARDDA